MSVDRWAAVGCANDGGDRFCLVERWPIGLCSQIYGEAFDIHVESGTCTAFLLDAGDPNYNNPLSLDPYAASLPETVWKTDCGTIVNHAGTGVYSSQYGITAGDKRNALYFEPPSCYAGGAKKLLWALYGSDNNFFSVTVSASGATLKLGTHTLGHVMTNTTALYTYSSATERKYYLLKITAGTVEARKMQFGDCGMALIQDIIDSTLPFGLSENQAESLILADVRGLCPPKTATFSPASSDDPLAFGWHVNASGTQAQVVHVGIDYAGVTLTCAKTVLSIAIDADEALSVIATNTSPQVVAVRRVTDLIYIPIWNSGVPYQRCVNSSFSVSQPAMTNKTLPIYVSCDPYSDAFVEHTYTAYDRTAFAGNSKTIVDWPKASSGYWCGPTDDLNYYAYLGASNQIGGFDGIETVSGPAYYDRRIEVKASGTAGSVSNYVIEYNNAWHACDVNGMSIPSFTFIFGNLNFTSWDMKFRTCNKSTPSGANGFAIAHFNSECIYHASKFVQTKIGASGYDATRIWPTRVYAFELLYGPCAGTASTYHPGNALGDYSVKCGTTIDPAAWNLSQVNIVNHCTGVRYDFYGSYSATSRYDEVVIDRVCKAWIGASAVTMETGCTPENSIFDALVTFPGISTPDIQALYSVVGVETSIVMIEDCTGKFLYPLPTGTPETENIGWRQIGLPSA